MKTGENAQSIARRRNWPRRLARDSNQHTTQATSKSNGKEIDTYKNITDNGLSDAPGAAMIIGDIMAAGTDGKTASPQKTPTAFKIQRVFRKSVGGGVLFLANAGYPTS